MAELPKPSGRAPGQTSAPYPPLLPELQRRKAAALAFCNAPETGPDNRTVKGIDIYDVFIEEETGDIIDRIWVDRLCYIVVCALRDE